MKVGERIELLKETARLLAERDDWAETDLVLRQFDQPTTDMWQGDGQYAYVLQMIDRITDERLIELHGYLAGASRDVPHMTGGPWAEGWFRLFLSHVSAEKVYVSEVKQHLLDLGVDAFVAHEDIEPTKEWESTIEVALGTCDALAAFLHDGFRESRWTDQEVGYALALRVKILPVKFTEDPHGFIARYQAIPGWDREPAVLADAIFEALLADDATRQKATDGLIAALCDSMSYNQANARARRLHRVGDWTPARLERLATALKNDQVAHAFSAEPIINGLLRTHRRPPVADDVPF